MSSDKRKARRAVKKRKRFARLRYLAGKVARSRKVILSKFKPKRRRSQ